MRLASKAATHFQVRMGFLKTRQLEVGRRAIVVLHRIIGPELDATAVVLE